jgi:hypothetical protein
MRLLAGDLIFGMTSSQIALLAGGAGLVYALRRWRQNVVQRQAAGQAAGRGSIRPAPASSVGLNRPMAVQGSGGAPAGGNGGMKNPLSVRELTVEIQALLAEVEDTARRAAAQVDNRYRKLEQLVTEADERIKRLEALIGEAERAGQGASPAVTGGADLLNRLRQDRGAPAAAEDPAYRPIYQLADLGKSAREIAQELGRQPGEVELILALRGRARV